MAGPFVHARRLLAAAGGGLPATFWWLFTGILVNALATFVFPFLALYLASRGVPPARTGLVVAAYGGGSVLSGPVAGLLADRLGRRPTLLGSLLASAALTLALAAATSPVAIAAAALAVGLVAHAYRPVAMATVADVVATPDRSRAFGLVSWASNLGIAVSLVGAGALVRFGYPVLFAADAATTLLFALLAWSAIPETRPPAPHVAPGTDEPARGGGGFREVARDRAFVAFCALLLVFLVPFCQFLVGVPLDMAQRGYPPAALGRVLAVNGFLIALLQPWIAPLLRRLDPSHVMAAATAVVGLGYGGYALAGSEAGYAAATAVWTLGEIAFFPVANAFVADLAPAHLRGRYQGAYSASCWGLAMIVAPALGGAVLQQLGGTALWVGCLAVELAVASAHLALAGSRRRALARRRRDVSVGAAPEPGGPAPAAG